MAIRTPDLIVDPVANPTMEEILFWLRIMREHLLFIRLGLPVDQPALIAEDDRLYAMVEALENEGMGVIPVTLPDYLTRVRVAVDQVWAYKRHLLHGIITCRVMGKNTPLLIDHMSREAAYFIKVLDKLADGQTDPPIDSVVQENVFWLRIMMEHMQLTLGDLDPSEPKLQMTAKCFAEEFQKLLGQARDLESMLWDFGPINTLRRFENDARDATVRVREFKTQLLELLQNCAALSIIPPLLADHMQREAEKFLGIIEAINQMINCQA